MSGCVAAALVLVYITLGGLSSAIYNEVLQIFAILAALIPLTIVGLIDVGGWSGLKDAVGKEQLFHIWDGTAPGAADNPLGASWIPIVFGLGFVLSFGYWTTNFAEVQRALSAKTLGAARRTPLFATFIIGMFWKRTTPAGGICGIVAGTLGAIGAHYADKWGLVDLGSDQAAAFWGAIAAFVADAVVTVAVSLVTKPKPIEELQGLVYGMANDPGREPRSEQAWLRRPQILAGGVLALTAGPSFMFI